MNADILYLYIYIHRSTYVKRIQNEAVDDYQFRVIVKAVRYYIIHLSECKIFMVTESSKKNNLGNILGIHSLTMNHLLTELKHKYNDDSNILNLSDLISVVVESKDDSGNSNKTLYKKHWDLSKVNTCINNGSIFKGKYKSMKCGKYAKGQVYINKDGKQKIVKIIGESNINRAIHDDIIAVELINDNEGRVVSVIKKNWRQYCGSLQETNKISGFCMFCPIDKRIPFIRINTKQIQNLMNKRIIVRIDVWKLNEYSPSGHYCETIGNIGDLECETQVLLIEHDIPHEIWSDNVLKCLPKSNVIDTNEYKNRIDLRSENIVSVDPVGCVDIDDALHCKELINGNIQIGVHIADVSHYVKPSNALDIEAAKRGTSVYLVDRRIDMLPSLLSTDMCSLKPNVDRLAFSVIWEFSKIDDEWTVIDTKFMKTVIHNKYAFNYEEAMNAINDANKTDDITKSLRILLKVSKTLKKNRLIKGALQLSSPQPKFKLDLKTKKPVKLENYPIFDTNSMIEEFMLLANISVAKKILESLPTLAMLRRHPSPTDEMLSKLVKLCKVKGYDINVDNSLLLSKSLNKIKDVDDDELQNLIKIMATRCMTQAVYFNSGNIEAKKYYHYGLATEIYTHFTSPIRRYADIIVHRQLGYCINIHELTNEMKNKELMNSICDNINRRHRLAQYINRSSNNLYTMLYFDKKIEYTIGIISNMDKNNIDVYIPKFCLETRIYLFNNRENEKYWKFDENNMILSRTKTPALNYQIFDKINVKIWVNTSKFKRKKLIVDIVDKNGNNVINISNDVETINEPGFTDLNYDVQ